MVKVSFFVIKHLGIEKSIHTALSKYSIMLYQEYTRDQFQDLSQKLVENATIYFHLLNSAISNAKVDAQKFPDQEQITRLIIEQLLSLKLEDDEAALRELNLHDLYSKFVDDFLEKSESSLLKWIVYFFIDKPAIISSIIETGINSFIKPDLNGNASGLDLLIRDGLRTIYKKFQQPEEDSQEKPLPSNPLVEKFVENLMHTFNQHRNIQQIASSTKIAVAQANLKKELHKHGSRLEGILDQQIKNYKQLNYNTELLLDAKNTQALGEKDRESFSFLPVFRDKILNIFFPEPETRLLQQHTISLADVGSDKINTTIKAEVDDKIREKFMLDLTKLSKAPPSEEILYDWLYQGLGLINQTIESPKENKEKQEDVKEEITELLSDISALIASKAPKTAIKDIIKRAGLSSKLASWISPIIQERLQNIVDLATQEALYQPELIAQLGRRVILPTTTFLRTS
ncbi:MAG: hypothetical protein M3A24_00230 [Candidatus Rhabdochlamydia oedothoracis]|nr:hypothetical protein [Candidatus Rhabdochlamydia oedothoracis]